MDQLARLLAIMARLRAPDGCPWDREQSFATIAPYTIEEAYEVADAIERGDMGGLREELGDLLLQVVFHARMAEEAGLFGLADVAQGVADKMERRHPHVFADTRADTAGEVLANWEAIKAAEKPRLSAMDDVPSGFPALMRAEKLQKRAARLGFDWPDASGPRSKVMEELAELDAATGEADAADELGDLLFAAVNLARHRGIDPESALRAANAKFERRFRSMEAAAGAGFAALPLADKDRLWDAAKVAERV